MTDSLAFAWLGIYLAAQVVAVLLLYRYPTPTRPGTVIFLALTLIFAAPLGLLAVVVAAAIYVLRSRGSHAAARQSATGELLHKPLPHPRRPTRSPIAAPSTVALDSPPS